MKKYICELCNNNFSSLQSLETHKNKKFKCNIDNKFKCDKCNKSFKYKKNLKEHIIKNNCNKLNDNNSTNTNDNNINDAIIAILNKDLTVDKKITFIKY
jgi:uncharacterized Zn-finger protein